MELQYDELENGIRLIKLIGKLDIGENRVIESQLILHCAGSQVKVIVDTSEINSVTHTGAQLLLWTAKEVVSRGGKFVVFNPMSAIEYKLNHYGIRDWAQIHSDINLATSFLLA